VISIEWRPIDSNNIPTPTSSPSPVRGESSPIFNSPKQISSNAAEICDLSQEDDKDDICDLSQDNETDQETDDEMDQVQDALMHQSSQGCGEDVPSFREWMKKMGLEPSRVDVSLPQSTNDNGFDDSDLLTLISCVEGDLCVSPQTIDAKDERREEQNPKRPSPLPLPPPRPVELAMVQGTVKLLIPFNPRVIVRVDVTHQRPADPTFDCKEMMRRLKLFPRFSFRLSPSIVKSILQKNVRLRRTESALRVAAYFLLSEFVSSSSPLFFWLMPSIKD